MAHEGQCENSTAVDHDLVPDKRAVTVHDCSRSAEEAGDDGDEPLVTELVVLFAPPRNSEGDIN
jgi:hypothetical protein